MAYSGESTLVEAMLPFPTTKEYLEEVQLQYQDSNEVLDLAKILACYDQEFLPDDDYYEDEPESRDSKTYPVELIFSREDVDKKATEEEETIVTEVLTPPKEQSKSVSTTIPKKVEISKSQSKPKFFQTQNVEYRTVMEELILVNCCSKQIQQVLEETKLILSQNVVMKHDPGFGSISKARAWTWILKEALIIVNNFGDKEKDKLKAEQLSLFTNEICSRVEKTFKSLYQELRCLKRIFDKAELEFMGTISKAQKRFSNNQEAAEEYEIRTAAQGLGLNFPLFGSQLNPDSYQDCCELFTTKPKSSKKSSKRSSNSSVASKAKKVKFPHRTLHVRCSIDGITIRSGVPSKPWLKIQTVRKFKDLQTLLKLFLHGMCKDAITAIQSVGLANEVLDVNHGRDKKRRTEHFKDSILQSILKCKDIIDRPKRNLSFLPKEEVMILFSLKMSIARFKLMKPLVVDLLSIFEKDYEEVMEFCNHRRDFKKHNKLSRVPIDRMTKLDMTVEDTNINVALILNRYPNRQETKRMIEKLLQGIDLSKGEDFLDAPIEIVYRCPSDLYVTPSTQEMLDWSRRIAKEEKRRVILPNPAYYLLSDVEREYNDMTVGLVTDRKITPENLALCSDPIRKFHQEIENIDIFKGRIVGQLMQATENLLYTEVHDDADNDTKFPTLVPTSFWIQILCRMLHVWDYKSLPKHCQNHFISLNGKSLVWIEKVETAFTKFEESVKNFKDECQKLQECIESVHGFSTWIKRKFNFTLPQNIVTKWRNQTPLKATSAKDILNETSNPDQDLPDLELRFSPFDMEILTVGPDNTLFHLISLNKCSDNVQVGIVSTFFTFLDNFVSQAMVNLNSAHSLLENNFTVKNLKSVLAADKKFSNLQHIHQLEDMILALCFEKNNKIIKEITTYSKFLESAISQFNHLFQIVQLQLEDRGILKAPAPSTKREELRKEVLQEELNPLKHDNVWLHETRQIFRSSVESMPTIFEIRVDSLKHSLFHWVKTERNDRRLMEIIIKKNGLNKDKLEEEEQEGEEEEDFEDKDK